ncbi:hypothetical protein [Salmonella phage SE13]|uniref:Uncharacterized protein n=1 Tax=Salmonella phage SE13 TaxID=2575325 RepID=A0A513ZWV7_9CAUD|nr:hypothetical protein HWC19_gp72 [Salmonella phage SE13]QDH45178.1 hypothetical protein [Salmonella phage SE13]
MNEQPSMSLVYQAPAKTGEFAGTIHVIHAEEIISIAFVEKTKKEKALRVTTKSGIIDITNIVAGQALRTMFNNYCALIGAALYMQPEETTDGTEPTRTGVYGHGTVVRQAGEPEPLDGAGQSGPGDVASDN